MHSSVKHITRTLKYRMTERERHQAEEANEENMDAGDRLRCDVMSSRIERGRKDNLGHQFGILSWGPCMEYLKILGLQPSH